ncbi:MAG TPA: hypothetical protein VNK26_04955, partial [Pyrinomonadaceae bacterium]|nr:hypothetical protein [Pyrinomonadaceae bacterium]
LLCKNHKNLIPSPALRLTPIKQIDKQPDELFEDFQPVLAARDFPWFFEWQKHCLTFVCCYFNCLSPGFSYGKNRLTSWTTS